MHELGIAASILESVQTEGRRHPEGRITKVGVKIGELSGVDRDALQFGFEVLVKDTEWEPVVLDLEYLPRVQRCTRGRYSNSSTTGSHSVSFTRTSKPNCSASRSTPDSSPILTPTLVMRPSGCRRPSVWTDSRMEAAMPSSCMENLQNRRNHCRTADRPIGAG